MTNIFPQDHLFTRLLAEAEAAEAAARADRERQEREAEQQKQETIASALSELTTLLGADFMAAIEPYVVEVTYSNALLTIRLDIPQHNDIRIYYNPHGHVTVQTYGRKNEYFSPRNMMPFARALETARERYANDAAEIAHNRAIEAAQAEYEAERARVREANRAALERLQAEYDGDFELYTLEYGIIVNDGEQELGTGTDTVKVLCDDSDESDRWLVVDYYGVIRRQKFFYPVSLTGTDQYRASDKHHARAVRLDGYGVVGYIPPLTDDADMRIAAYAQRAAAVLQPLPAMPEILNGLDI